MNAELEAFAKIVTWLSFGSNPRCERHIGPNGKTCSRVATWSYKVGRHTTLTCAWHRPTPREGLITVWKI